MTVPLTLSRMGLFRGCSRMGGRGGGEGPHPKICHIFSYNDDTWHNSPEEDQKNI